MTRITMTPESHSSFPTWCGYWAGVQTRAWQGALTALIQVPVTQMEIVGVLAAAYRHPFGQQSGNRASQDLTMTASEVNLPKTGAEERGGTVKKVTAVTAEQTKSSEASVSPAASESSALEVAPEPVKKTRQSTSTGAVAKRRKQPAKPPQLPKRASQSKVPPAKE